MSGPGRDDSAGERALTELLLRSRLAASDDLPGVVAQAARHLDAADVVLHLVDHAQAWLVPFGTEGAPASIDGTVVGRAFSHVEVVAVPAADGSVRVHMPLLDSVERIGTMSLTVPAAHARGRLVAFAALVAEVLRGKAVGSDLQPRVARLREMSLAGEVQWALLPPLTVATERVVISAMLEPAYDVGGDVIDHAVDRDVAHFAVFDAMGHSLDAAVLASVAVGAYRAARRAGRDLAEVADAIDTAVCEQFAESRLVTAVIARLDLEHGRLRWVNAGHPPPLLLRGGRFVRELIGTPQPPFGLGLRAATAVNEEQLEPGDRVLGYTDGVVEATDAEGEHFGLQRLVELVTHAEAAGVHAPETMRRVSRAVLEHGRFRLRDDATHLLVEWLTGEPQRLVL